MNPMSMSSMHPARRWNCYEVMTKVDKYVYNVPLNEIVSFGVWATMNKTVNKKDCTSLCILITMNTQLFDKEGEKNIYSTCHQGSHLQTGIEKII